MSIETSNRLPGAEARRLTSVLALDVCGYSALSERDEGLAIQVVTAVRRLVDAKARKFGGRRFHKAADGFLVEFQSPISALSAALEMQEAIASDLPAIPDFTVLARVGLHVGEVQEQEDGDLLGHGVNIAARLQQEADPGGILVSSNLLNLVGDQFTGRRRRRGHMALKNISEPIEAFDIEATQTTVSRAIKRIQKVFRRNALVFSLFAIGVVVAIAIPVLMEGAKSGNAQLDGRVEAIIEESFSDDNGRAVRSIDSAYIRGVLRRLGESGQPTDQASFAMLEAGNIEGGIEVLSEHLSELSPSSDAYVPLLHQIGALAFSYNSDKAIATYESILLKDPEDVVAQVYLARSIGHHGKQKQAARLYEKALASDKLDQVGRLNVRMNLAFLKILDGEYERAVEMLIDLEPEVNALGRPDVTETLYTEKGIALERVDRLDEAEADLLAALAIQKQYGYDHNMERAYNVLGMIALKRADLDKDLSGAYLSKAERFFELQYEVADRIGKVRSRAESAFYIGDIELRRGNYDAAEKSLMNAFRIAREARNLPYQFLARVWLADLAHINANAQLSCKHLAEAATLYEQRENKHVGPRTKAKIQALPCSFLPVTLQD